MSTAQSFPAVCLRRMERVDDPACYSCFTSHPQLVSAYKRRMRCVESNLVQLEPILPALKEELLSDKTVSVLECVAAQLRREGRTDGEIGAFGRGLVLLIETI